MCHQSVGLIARHLEEQGIPTLCLSSAWSITAAVNPPRAAFLDFPLGHTAGRPNDLVEQIAIMRAALQTFATAPRGSITRLPFRWSDTDQWKADLMSAESGDDRIERIDTPQYQSPDDAAVADAACPSCVWL